MHGLAGVRIEIVVADHHATPPETGRRPCPISFYSGCPGGFSDQAFQQQLELADFHFDLERAVERVEDRDGEGPVVAVSFEEVDDPAVLDFPLADADLELAGLAAGVP